MIVKVLVVAMVIELVVLVVVKIMAVLTLDSKTRMLTYFLSYYYGRSSLLMAITLKTLDSVECKMAIWALTKALGYGVTMGVVVVKLIVAVIEIGDDEESDYHMMMAASTF